MPHVGPVGYDVDDEGTLRFKSSRLIIPAALGVRRKLVWLYHDDLCARHLASGSQVLRHKTRR